jgi:hypothetical protein
MRLVGAQIWIRGRLIGAWIVQRALEERNLNKKTLSGISSNCLMPADNLWKV